MKIIGYIRIWLARKRSKRHALRLLELAWQSVQQDCLVAIRNGDGRKGLDLIRAEGVLWRAMHYVRKD